MSIFLDQSDVAILTGKKLKSQQVEFLRGSGILFYVNAAGHPVVPKDAVVGLSKKSDQPDKPWVSSLMSNHG